jgi:NAD(P)-dependent dehydrogenase (short-subunit alcohol dehydrogenase family)
MNIGTVEDVPIDTARRQFEALVFGPFRLAQLALPAMRRRGDGRIVNVVSAAAHAAGPLLGWYGAAKHAMGAATEAFRAEVAGWGIDVVSVEPGAVRTPIWDKAEAELERRAPTSHTPGAYERGLAVLRASRPRMPGPEAVATVVGDALQAGRPRRTYKVGWDSWVLPAACRVVPPGAKDKVARAVLRL